MKQVQQYKDAITSGDIETNEASIQLTPEMFDMLSSKVYKDKILAVVREIICNARDAHVENNIDKPLTISLPTTFDPVFSVRDYGTGLSHDQIMELYLSYGNSTKTKSNTGIGGFGIGSKAPFAYAASFVVLSFQGGEKRAYSIYKENGIPRVSHLATTETSEPDGLCVEVPVQAGDFHWFKDKVERFMETFSYPSNIPVEETEPTIETDDYVVYKRQQLGVYSDRYSINIGGVVYPISDSLLHPDFVKYTRQCKQTILKFPIGSLSIAPSRETLSEDKQTLGLIKEVSENLAEDFVKSIQKEIDTLEHPYQVDDLLRDLGLIEADLDIQTGITSLKTSAVFTYKGKDVTEAFEGCFAEVTRTKQFYSSYGTKKKQKLRYHNADDPFVRMDVATNFISTLQKAYDNATLIYTDEEQELVKWWFGITDDDIDLLSVKRAELELDKPKESRVAIAQKLSFNGTRCYVQDVTTIESKKGWIVPLYRNKVNIKSIPSLEVWSMLKFFSVLFNSGTLSEGTNVYFVGKSHLKKFEKRGFKTFTRGKLLRLIKRAIKTSQINHYLLDQLITRMKANSFTLPKRIKQEFEVDFSSKHLQNLYKLEDELRASQKGCSAIPSDAFIFPVTEILDMKRGADYTKQAQYVEKVIKVLEDLALVATMYRIEDGKEVTYLNYIETELDKRMEEDDG